jgi:hypothetical protein
VSGPPKDGFAVANNFCAEAIGIEDDPKAIKEKRRKKRDSVFIEKDEASKLPLNKRDATLISSIAGRDDHIKDAAKRRFCLSKSSGFAGRATKSLRKGWDSNPRWVSPRSISSRVP